MINSNCTDSEILRACAFIESPLTRTVAERLRARVDQIDLVRVLAEMPTEDPAQTLRDVADLLTRD